MKHVRDPVPSAREKRPDVPERVDAVVAKAMAKDPRDRFGSMDALAAALESCLDEVREQRQRRPEEQTGIMKPPPRAEPEPARTQAIAKPAPASATARTRAAAPKRSGLRIAGILLLAAVILVGNLLVLELVLDDGLPGFGGSEAAPARVVAVSDFDPQGDGTEHPESVARATDGKVPTFWATETYRSFDKDGVGIIVDAGSNVALARMVVVTGTSSTSPTSRRSSAARPSTSTRAASGSATTSSGSRA
jgi:serine/threonine-protein kinase